MGDRITEARVAAGLTQPDVAAAIGVKQQQVSAWERGTRIPDRHRAALAGVLGIDLTDLLTWIADEEQDRHDTVKRELAATVQSAERNVELLERILALLQRLSDQQTEMLRLQRESDGGKRRA